MQGSRVRICLACHVTSVDQTLTSSVNIFWAQIQKKVFNTLCNIFHKELKKKSTPTSVFFNQIKIFEFVLSNKIDK